MHSEVKSVLVEHAEHTYSVAGKKLHTNVPAPIYSERKVGKKIIKRTELSEVGYRACRWVFKTNFHS